MQLPLSKSWLSSWPSKSQHLLCFSQSCCSKLLTQIGLPWWWWCGITAWSKIIMQARDSSNCLILFNIKNAKSRRCKDNENSWKFKVKVWRIEFFKTTRPRDYKTTSFLNKKRRKVLSLRLWVFMTFLSWSVSWNWV